MSLVRKADSGDILLEQFGQLAYQFLDASCEVWPDDSVLKGWKAEFDAANAVPAQSKAFVKRAYDAFQDSFAPHFALLQNRDQAIFDQDIEFLTRVDARGKYYAAHPDVQKTVWDYVKQLVQSATIGQVYSGCPKNMMDRVSTMADQIVKDIEAGKFNIAALNPAELSKQMMEGMDREELEAWSRSVMQNGNLENIMGLVQNALGGNGGGLPGISPEMLQGLMGNMPLDLSQMDFSAFLNPKKK
jgi:hypothetical protein